MEKDKPVLGKLLTCTVGCMQWVGEPADNATNCPICFSSVAMIKIIYSLSELEALKQHAQYTFT